MRTKLIFLVIVLVLLIGCTKEVDIQSKIMVGSTSFSSGCEIRCSNGFAYTDTMGCNIFSALEEKEFNGVNCTRISETIQGQDYLIGTKV